MSALKSSALSSLSSLFDQAGPFVTSTHHFELKVEENWKASAKDVAATVTRVAQDIDAQLLVLAGDVHAVDLLREHALLRYSDNADGPEFS
ncbi:MAG TPA: Vms1/Ankzf1 family peptidyl-tRNA hydrolase [Frankiaceae bacterium]|nr:Vms1/Ankzf1 family peptidyl-tRNA hydrolase [Frankiaceae bacterium]